MNGQDEMCARAQIPCQDGESEAENGDNAPERTGSRSTHSDAEGCEQASSSEGERPAGSQGPSASKSGQNCAAIAAGLTETQRAFLAAYIITGTIGGGARAAQIHRNNHYQWMDADENYRDAFAHATEDAADNAEEEARRRAFAGLRKYKFLKDGTPILHPVTGEPYYEDVYSDTLALAILRALRPDKYRDNLKLEHAGGTSSTVTVRIVEDEDWFGNDAHDRAAETPPAPAGNPAE